MNAKKTWEILRKAINNKSKKSNSIQKIIENGEIFDYPKHMAFKFFTKVANYVISTVQPPNVQISFTPLAENAPQFKFDHNAVTGLEILEVIKQLKDKTYLDSNFIFTVFIEKIAQEISYPLQIIFQSSLSTRMVPYQLKIAKIVTIF